MTSDRTRNEGEADLDALVAAAAAGDRRSFEALVLRRRERVVRTAYQVTGNLEDARDVAQGVFLKLWGVLPRFDARQRFDTWLYRITVNAAIDHLRSRAPRSAVQQLPEDPSDLAVDPAPGAEQVIGRAELQRAFTHLAARLGTKQRAAFVLREIEGLETAEVARILGVRESTVRNHLLQARRALRAGLEREYPDLVPKGREEDPAE